MNKISQELDSILCHNLEGSVYEWVQEKLSVILEATSAKEFYLTYSLIGAKVDNRKFIDFSVEDKIVKDYLEIQRPNLLQIARIFLLSRVLEENHLYFKPKVANLIEIADIGELETFLKFLILLPDAGDFKNVAVEALRTNISTIFDAISLNNSYPSKYFNEQQWNQMYLKATFMQRDITSIIGIDKRSNKNLAQIISDYAHERWAASRDVDPMLWRPVSRFLEGVLLEDMKRLFESVNVLENQVAALCCFYSGKKEAQKMLDDYPELKKSILQKNITWQNLKE